MVFEIIWMNLRESLGMSVNFLPFYCRLILSNFDKVQVLFYLEIDGSSIMSPSYKFVFEI